MSTFMDLPEEPGIGTTATLPSPPCCATADRRLQRGAGRRPGKVVLVGAGPGDPDLLTVRAVQRIGLADVLVYDRLIQPGVLDLANPSAERIYMGKPAGCASLQDSINAVLVEKAREGGMVVRLKGGDPFLFGRGGEEIEYLARHGIPFEVIPGVSSSLAAPLSANIPVTHRDASSSVVIVTGHVADGHEDRVDWEAVARIDTSVFLMGVHNVGGIAQNLIAAGRSPSTPAAMIQMAYWEGEYVVIATLGTMAEAVHRHCVQPPATLVVGEVVRLRDKLQQLMTSCSETEVERKEVLV